MKILGIHIQSHDTSVALISKGKIVYAAANERFSRKKMDKNTPLEVLENCLHYTKTKVKDIDKVVIVGDRFPYSFLGRFKELSWPFFLTHGKYLLWWKSLSHIFYEILIATGIPSFIYREWFPRLLLNWKLRDFKKNYIYIHHHMAHLYSAYYTSSWKDCLVLCAEGSGFSETFSIYQVKNEKWIKIVENYLPHSAGKFYELVTILLGFNVLRHPGKITGLAAYGDSDKAYKHIQKLLRVEGLKLALDYNTYLKWRIGYETTKELPLELKKYKREDIAAAFQRRLEECVVEIIKNVVAQTKEKKIAVAGGVMANVKLNQKILENAGIEKIHIHQAMGDDGLALGAALHVSHLNGYTVLQPQNVYFGPDFSESEILKSLKKYNVVFKKVVSIEKEIAKLLAENKVVARFDGRMEYGPRALGNRSVLYSTKDKKVNDWLNKRLKRTEFMPFAPVTLSEFADKCYMNLNGAEYSSKFMTITFQCTEFMKKNSPAVVHVDGTARPQILFKKDNPSYYKILSEYFKLTNIPSLVNTSFNMHEEPIVCTPDDAIRSFLAGGLDILAIGKYLVTSQDYENNKKN